jgi:hypothetical protein
MVFRLQLRQIPADGWDVEAATATDKVETRFTDPFKDAIDCGEEPEEAIEWYLERYFNEPFETTKADAAADALTAYGRRLATQVVQTGLLPKHGDVELEIVTNCLVATRTTEESLTNNNLQQLHWEVLEDIKIWPPAYKFKSVSVTRLLQGTQPKTSSDGSVRAKSFRVLLVVSRPDQTVDIDYQIVSRCLVAIIDRVSKAKPDVKASLKVLRPPTWQEFQQHLQHHDYDIVHFDMHGRIKNPSKTSAVYVLRHF